METSCNVAPFTPLDVAPGKSLQRDRVLVFAAFASHPVDFRLLAVEVPLVTSDFRLLAIIAILLALHLITYERSCSQTKPAADCRTRCRVTHSGSDETARCGAA